HRANVRRVHHHDARGTELRSDVAQHLHGMGDVLEHVDQGDKIVAPRNRPIGKEAVDHRQPALAGYRGQPGRRFYAYRVEPSFVRGLDHDSGSGSYVEHPAPCQVFLSAVEHSPHLLQPLAPRFLVPRVFEPLVKPVDVRELRAEKEAAALAADQFSSDAVPHVGDQKIAPGELARAIRFLDQVCLRTLAYPAPNRGLAGSYVCARCGHRFLHSTMSTPPGRAPKDFRRWTTLLSKDEGPFRRPSSPASPSPPRLPRSS